MSRVRSLPKGLDRVGFLLSVGCALHCAAMPLIAGLLSVSVVGTSVAETTEGGLLVVAAATALASMLGGCRHHGQLRPILLMLGGFALVLAGRTLAPEGSMLEVLTTVTGGAAVASAHLANWRSCCAHPAPAR